MNDLRHKLYDGFEEELYNKNYGIIYGNQKISFTAVSFKNPLEELYKEVPDDIVAKIIKTFKFKVESSLIFERAYTSDEGLRIYYQIIENAIIFVSLGEFQPGRYMLFYEGIWDLVSRS